VHRKEAMKNILFIEYCADLKAGGAQRVFLNILKSISANKYSIFAGFPLKDGSELSREIPSYVETYNYDSKSPDSTQNKLVAYLTFALFIPITILNWFFIIKRNNIQAVYVHSIISGFHFGLLKYLLGYKLIYHEHNMASQRPKMILWRWMFEFVVFRSDKIIAISKDVAADLVKFGATEEKINVIHNGIELINDVNYDMLKSKGMQRLAPAVTDDSLVVGMVGHFRPWKGQQLFVESLEGVVSSYPHIHFVIVGGVHDRTYYDQVTDYIKNNGLSGHITVTGHQDNVAELMACFDIVVVPSVPEPFGLVLLEAMMLDRPVVAFDIGGPSEIVAKGKTGLLVDEVNSQSLGLAISDLAADKNKRESMGREGRKLLEEQFTIAIQGKNVERLIDGLFTP